MAGGGKELVKPLARRALFIFPLFTFSAEAMKANDFGSYADDEAVP